MKTSLRALVWEQVWRSRIVFPLLGVLLLVGAGLVEALRHAKPEDWWVPPATQGLFVSVVATLVLAFAPFTLMENHHGWRMNSMVTRWFVLPVRTAVLVFVPYVTACLSVGFFVGLWMLVLRRLDAGFSCLHVLRVMVFGVAVTQCFAWLLSRRPTVFWPIMALWFPVVLLVALVPSENPGAAGFRAWVAVGVPIALPLLGGVAWVAARRARCGASVGELRFLPDRWRWPGLRMPASRSPKLALFWSDVLPVLRTFLVSWVGVVCLVLVVQVLLYSARGRSSGLPPGTVFHLAVILMWGLAVVWLPLWGILLGGEPGTAFRTKLSSYRAVAPVSAGGLAAQRLWAALGIWLTVWIPWLLLVSLHYLRHPEVAEMDLPRIQAGSARWMAISAHALVGGLPLMLWGRLEGLPNLLLVSMGAWAGTWWLAGMFNPADGTGQLPILLGLLLGAKFVVGSAGLWVGWRRGHTTAVFVAILPAVWLGVWGLLVWGLASWGSLNRWEVAQLALFIPFARLAFCPLAVAANRHR